MLVVEYPPRLFGVVGDTGHITCTEACNQCLVHVHENPFANFGVGPRLVLLKGFESFVRLSFLCIGFAPLQAYGAAVLFAGEVGYSRICVASHCCGSGSHFVVRGVLVGSVCHACAIGNFFRVCYRVCAFEGYSLELAGFEAGAVEIVYFCAIAQ